MKRSIIILSALVGFFVLSSTSCEKEPYTVTKPIESAIFNQIKAHRTNNGLGPPFVQQFEMVMEAQLYSAKMAFGAQAVDTTGIRTHWDTFHDKFAGGTNELCLVQSIISSASAADIVKVWTDVPETDSLLLLDYTQCAAGVEINNGIAYVTLMMLHFD
jgi:hypothetical protein